MKKKKKNKNDWLKWNLKSILSYNMERQKEVYQEEFIISANFTKRIPWLMLTKEIIDLFR